MSNRNRENGIIGWIDRRLPFFTFLRQELDEYPNADCLLLTYAGGRPPAGVWLVMSRFGAAYYFLFFLLVMPLVGIFEKTRPLPASIGEPTGKT